MKKTIALLTALFAAPAYAADAPVVLELFTSQGCSSCPPADELLTSLAKDPSILPLSFHVHYWDYLGWKDPYSSEQNTGRQRGYAQSLRQNSVFTPQLVVNGSYSAVGSSGGDVNSAVTSARRDTPAATITITPDGKTYRIHVEKLGATAPSAVYAVRYRRHASTLVAAGENSGHMLKSINNVTEFTQLGEWANKSSDFQLPITGNDDEGVAVLLQNNGQGHIVSAQYYPK